MRFAKRLILTAAVALLGVASAQAGPLGLLGRGRCQAGTAAVASPSCGTATAQAGGVQWKADVQARAGRCFHPGGGFVPGASFEGVGYSSASPEHALSMCCNNGGPVVAQAVARGPGGWYAVKQYAAPGGGPVRTLAGGLSQTAGATLQAAGQVVSNFGVGLTTTTSYQPPAVGLDATPYRPIRLATPLPTCPNGQCGK